MANTIDEVIKAGFGDFQDYFKNTDKDSDKQYTHFLMNKVSDFITSTDFNGYGNFVAFLAFKNLHSIGGKLLNENGEIRNADEEFVKFKKMFENEPSIIEEYFTEEGSVGNKKANLSSLAFRFFEELYFIENEKINEALNGFGEDKENFFNSFGVRNYQESSKNFWVFKYLSHKDFSNVKSLKKVMELYLSDENFKGTINVNSPKMVEVSIMANHLEPNIKEINNSHFRLDRIFIGAIPLFTSDSVVVDITFKHFNKDYVKTYNFMKALSESKIIDSPTLFNEKNQLLALSIFFGDEINEKLSDNHSKSLSYSFEMVEDKNFSYYEPYKILKNITLEAYEKLLKEIDGRIDFNGEGNIIDEIPKIDEIVDGINENYLIPEFEEKLSLKVTKI